MKPGPRVAANSLNDSIEITQKPISARDLLVKVIEHNGWGNDTEDIYEMAEKWAVAFVQHAKKQREIRLNRGQLCTYTLLESSGDYICGMACPLPTDDEGTLAEKARRGRLHAYIEAVINLDYSDFELLCCGILALIGVEQPRITRQTADQGIDFFGRLNLKKFLQSSSLPGGVESQMSIWLVGQAKQYISTKISTKILRELFGSGQLAKSSIFAGRTNPLEGFCARVGDPVFYILITTGKISRDSWELAERSGLIIMEQTMIAAILCDNGVALTDNNFDQELLEAWINEFQTQIH